MAMALPGCSDPTVGEPTRSSSSIGLTFEQWKEKVKIRGYTDRFAVGDWATPLVIVGDDDARGYFDRHISKSQKLIIDNGQLAPGDPAPGPLYAFPPGATLVYCIDRAGLREVVDRYELPPGTDLYDIVAEGFGQAAAAWNIASGVNISWDTSRDETCSYHPGDNITWYVKPYFMDFNAPLEYLTFVLAPKYTQQPSQDLHDFFILDYLIQRQAPGAYVVANDPPWAEMFTFRGLLARAVSNGLGFIDEKNYGGDQVWPAACRDSSVGGIFLTDADPYSVTTHPASMLPILDSASQPCIGARPFDYAISYADAMGAACQYHPSAWTSFYYCQQDVQNVIRGHQPEDCSPVPLGPGSAGDCSGASWTDVQQDANRYAVAMYSAIFPR